MGSVLFSATRPRSELTLLERQVADWVETRPDDVAVVFDRDDGEGYDFTSLAVVGMRDTSGAVLVGTARVSPWPEVWPAQEQMLRSALADRFAALAAR